MCFKTKAPEVPKAPPVPSAEAEDAKRRRVDETAAQAAQQGRQATIITSPLGDPNFGKNINKTQLGGF